MRGQSRRRLTKIRIQKALVICSAGHPVEHLEEIGIIESMRKVMLNDQLLGVGVKEAHMEILGGMVPIDKTIKKKNLERGCQLRKTF